VTDSLKAYYSALEEEDRGEEQMTGEEVRTFMTDEEVVGK